MRILRTGGVSDFPAFLSHPAVNRTDTLAIAATV